MQVKYFFYVKMLEALKGINVINLKGHKIFISYSDSNTRNNPCMSEIGHVYFFKLASRI